MNGDPHLLRLGSSVLALLLLLPVLRAAEAAAPSPPRNGKSDPGLDGPAPAKASPAVRKPAVRRILTKQEMQLKLVRAKYDANGDGQLDAAEKEKFDADLALWTAKNQKALARYDANKNGVLDPEEKAKIHWAESLAERNERKFWSDQVQMQQRLRQLQSRPIPRLIEPSRLPR